MTFMEKHRFAGSHTEKSILKLSWEGEFFGVGLFEELARMYPEHADEMTACATMEWFNTHYCEPFTHDAGMHVTVERAEKLGREGVALARHYRTFEGIAKATIEETKEVDPLFKQLSKGAGTPELKALGDDLLDHENAMRDWMRSELDGKSDGAAKVFEYLERHGITREDAITPREDREDSAGDQQQLVLAFFDSEDEADHAAEALKGWEKATEYMKVDAIGVLVKDKDGNPKQHKLGRKAGKRGMGVGIALGLVAAIPTGGLSLVGGVLGGGAGGGIIGEFFHKGLKMTDEDAARIADELDAGHAAVGVLTWDFETGAVAQMLKELGGTPEAHKVAKVTAE
ncbi:hypothetical protein ABZ464_51460 [Streptomyces sp. NPDC005820]|uniref:hypothetical protein n=1 Tax=Streptomyces sp. NPDC005820 TaxID=3157069 RepID=UPI0033DA4B0E